MDESRSPLPEMGAALLNAFVDPRQAVAGIGHPKAWILPWVVVSAGTILVGLASQPYVLQAATASIPPGVPAERASAALRTVASTQQLGVLLAPAMVLLKWGLATAILFVSCVLMDLRVGARSVFSVVAYCAPILLLQDMMTYAVLRLSNRPIQGAADLVPHFGLDMVISSENRVLMSVLGYFSIPQVWYLAILILAMAFMAKTAKWKSAAVVAPLVIVQLTAIIVFSMAFGPQI